MTNKKTETEWSAEERAAMIEKMTHAKNVFYRLAVTAGHHQFVEFAGFMNEYIVLCTKAHEEGTDFSTLPMQHHNAAYIAEKLECIYGPTIKRSPELTKAFLVAFFGTTTPFPLGNCPHCGAPAGVRCALWNEGLDLKNGCPP